MCPKQTVDHGSKLTDRRYRMSVEIIYSYFMPVWGIVKTAAPRCRGQLDALLPEAERPRAMVHRAIHVTEGQ